MMMTMQMQLDNSLDQLGNLQKNDLPLAGRSAAMRPRTPAKGSSLRRPSVDNIPVQRPLRPGWYGAADSQVGSTEAQRPGQCRLRRQQSGKQEVLKRALCPPVRRRNVPFPRRWFFRPMPSRLSNMSVD